MIMDAAELHDWVSRYNWDDGLAPIWRIVESPRTEFATALMIYWRLDGPWLEQDVDTTDSGAKSLQDAVRDRLLNGFYSRGTCNYDPAAELSRTQIYKLQKAGLPPVLLGIGLEHE